MATNVRTAVKIVSEAQLARDSAGPSTAPARDPNEAFSAAATAAPQAWAVALADRFDEDAGIIRARRAPARRASRESLVSATAGTDPSAKHLPVAEKNRIEGYVSEGPLPKGRVPVRPILR